MAKVKICGMTDLRDALKAYELGCDYVGFIFFDQSPRKIDQEHARVMIEDLPKDLEKVGLFFNQNIDKRSEERRVGKECRSRWSPYH